MGESASDLLARTAKAYAEATTYQDEGVLTSIMTMEAGPIKTVQPFALAFERGGRLHWYYLGSSSPWGKPKDAYHVWSEDQKTYFSRWDLMPRTDRFDSIEMAFAGPTGVSGGTALLITSLLRPDMKCGRETALSEPTLKGSESIDGVECTVITGRSLGERSTTLWIDSAGLLRKLATSYEIDPAKLPPDARVPKMARFKVETTIVIKPRLNQPIDDQAFDHKSKPKR